MPSRQSLVNTLPLAYGVLVFLFKGPSYILSRKETVCSSLQKCAKPDLLLLLNNSLEEFIIMVEVKNREGAMKKFLILILASLLSLAVVPALANQTPWEDASVKIQIVEDFDSFANGQINLEESPFELLSSNLVHKFKWENGQLIAYSGGSGSEYFSLVTDNVSALTAESFEDAEGFGFYVENNTRSAIHVAPMMFCEGQGSYVVEAGLDVFGAEIGVGFDYLSFDASWQQTIGIIPEGFKGYYVVPFENVIHQQEQRAWESGRDYFNKIGFVFQAATVNEAKGDTVVLDNFFIYGQNLEDNNNGRIILDLGGGEEPTTTPEEEQTTAPVETAAATAQPTAAAPTETPKDTDKTAKDNSIYIIIGIAAVVIAGAAVLYFLFRKKPGGPPAEGEKPKDDNTEDKKE